MSRDDPTPFCPHCGYDLRASDPISYAGVEFDPRGEMIVAGRSLTVTLNDRLFAETLLRARGRYVATEAIASRLGFDGDDPVGAVRVYASRLRRALERHGAGRGIIETSYGRGYRWRAAA